jgi:Uncharacterised nucleotidyltransferase
MFDSADQAGVPVWAHPVVKDESRSPELELLLLCARTQIGEPQSQKIAEFLERGVEWNRLIEVGRAHGVLPLLDRALRDRAVNAMPAGVREDLRVSCEIIRFHGLVFLRELLSVLRVLDAAGINAVPWKGPALGAYLYGDVGLRQFGDVDLVVRPNECLAARRALMDRGYRIMRPMPDLLYAGYARIHCAFIFSLDGQLQIDLTWRMAPSYWCMPELGLDAWERLETITLAGTRVRSLSPTDLLCLLCIHGCKHGWGSLKWIVDVAELLRVHPGDELGDAFREARRIGAERMIALGLVLAHELLEAKVPQHALREAQNDAVIRALVAKSCQTLSSPQPGDLDIQASLAFVAAASDRWAPRLLCGTVLPLPYLLVGGMRRVRNAALMKGKLRGAPQPDGHDNA